jgi:hypothetical protein
MHTLPEMIHSSAIAEAHKKAHTLAKKQAILGSEFCLQTYLKIYTQEFQRIYQTTQQSLSHLITPSE